MADIAPERYFEALTDAPDSDAVIEMRDASRREIGIRIVPWDKPAHTKNGPEVIVRGAFDGVDPSKVVLRVPHKDPPVGRGISYENRPDGAYMVFRVAKTQAGDEALTLATDQIVTGASVGFRDIPGGTHIFTRNGVRLRVVEKADLKETAMVWDPTWNEAEVLFTRSNEKEIPVSETVVETKTDKPEPVDFAPITEAITKQAELHQRSLDAFASRFDKLEERYRSDIVIPGHGPEAPKPTIENWASYAVRTLTGTTVSQKELQERDLDDVVTAENPGLVPDALRNDLLIGVVNARRQFLQSTTSIAAPNTGMSIVVPVLSQRSTTAVQGTEKTEVDSTALRVTTASFDAVTIAGAADVSIQMIKRADPSFMDLLMRDLGHDYARKSDAAAIAALFAAGTTPGSANIDPEDLTIGEAWENSITATDEPPDTIWMSAAGVSAFINAKSDGTNAPLYFNLNSQITAGGGPGGQVSALRPVYVPALNATGVDVMIGPSTGFVWAEDGNIQLEVDNPGKAGRDIGLVGILFFVPRYPAAFTTYDLGS